MFLIATFECATTQTGALISSHVFTAADIVDVFPVPGGPLKHNTFSQNDHTWAGGGYHEQSLVEPRRRAWPLSRSSENY